MIKTLRLRNFQSHKDTVLDFHPGVNVIIGSTDSGKSAIRRSLAWLVFNKPLGTKFRSTWGGPTSVALKMDGRRVKRVRSNKANYYEIDGEQLPKFGSEPPNEVKEVLNIGEINFQDQHDTPFLLGKEWNPGRTARFINELIGADEIDYSQKNLLQFQKAQVQKAKWEKQREEKLTKELKELEWVKTAEAELEVLEKSHKNIRRKEMIISKCEKVFRELKAIEREIKETDTILQAGRDVNWFIGLEEQIENKRHRKEKVESILEQIAICDVRIKKAIRTEKEMEKEYHDKFPDICPLCGRRTKDVEVRQMRRGN